MDFSEEDRHYMKMALSLASRGKGMTHPNPMVGAAVVRRGSLLGRGFHKGPGEPHAEIEALRQAGQEAMGSDLYVTLEPCNHQGRTPPCSEAIIDSGVRRVIMAAVDPNPAVKGGGEKRLREAGIDVETGLLKEDAMELNAAYMKYMTTGMPLITLKIASTVDGKIAARGGVSRWISGEKARRAVHGMRRVCDAVIVGRGTVAADDPQLTVRMVPLGGANPPLRVVVDSRISLDLKSRLAAGGEPKVIIATTSNHDRSKAETLRQRGVEVMVLGDRDGLVDLVELLEALGKRGLYHLLVEGGPKLSSSLLALGLADRLALFISPKIFGDTQARSWVEGRVVTDPSQALKLVWRRTRRLGDDVLLEADMKRR
jgi:diaminohydroxyphosphoribosylaminopyrimidine deaminase/5-amino-6-(5-phosphoribosylamino)uracil reductase